MKLRYMTMLFVLFFIKIAFLLENVHLRQMKTKETENIIEMKPIIKDEIPAANSPLLS